MCFAPRKSGPGMVCFVHFDLEMCLTPQQRALFGHLNVKKWSEHVVLSTFWLGNVLRPTTACTFSTSELPKVVREWCALYILTWNCGSRHNGVQLFISHLARWLRTRHFSEPTFWPSRATNHGKTQWMATFLPFRALASSFFSLFLLSDLLTSFLLLSDSSHLCFSNRPYCRRFHFTSSLPSIILKYWLLRSNYLIHPIVIPILIKSWMINHFGSEPWSESVRCFQARNDNVWSLVRPFCKRPWQRQRRWSLPKVKRPPTPPEGPEA